MVSRKVRGQGQAGVIFHPPALEFREERLLLEGEKDVHFRGQLLPIGEHLEVLHEPVGHQGHFGFQGLEQRRGHRGLGQGEDQVRFEIPDPGDDGLP